MKKSCFDCFNFIASIPLEKSTKSMCKAPSKMCEILKKKLNYSKATAKCKHDLIVKGDGESRIFKNVLIYGKRLKAYECADTCPSYDGE